MKTFNFGCLMGVNTYTNYAFLIIKQIFESPQLSSIKLTYVHLNYTFWFGLLFADYDIDGQHTEIIRQNFTYLQDNLIPKCSGLLSLLFQKKVLDEREKGIIEADDSAICQTEKLLSVLSRKSSEQFDLFLGALDNTNHQHVANVLRNAQKSIESSSGTTLNVLYLKLCVSDNMMG